MKSCLPKDLILENVSSRLRKDEVDSSNSISNSSLLTLSKSPSKTEGKAKSDLEQLHNVLENMSKSKENT
jgi:hypothetical protein